MGEIDLLAELDEPCPRGCGRSVDECSEAEDEGECAGSPLVQRQEELIADYRKVIEEMQRRLERSDEDMARQNADLDLALAKLVRMGAVVQAAKAWRAGFPNQQPYGFADQGDGVLIAAVDALGVPVQRGEEEHTCGEIGNAMGGYDCVCGQPWLDSLGGCLHAPQEQIARNKAAWIAGQQRRLTAMPADEAAAMANSAVTSRGLAGALNLTPGEAEALDRLLDAILATEERWETLPALRRIRLKLTASTASGAGQAGEEVAGG